jgi:uncharacterized membrane protein
MTTEKGYTARDVFLAAIVGFLIGMVAGFVAMFISTVQQLEAIKEKHAGTQLTCHEHFKKCEICADMMDEENGRKP